VSDLLRFESSKEFLQTCQTETPIPLRPRSSDLVLSVPPVRASTAISGRRVVTWCMSLHAPTVASTGFPASGGHRENHHQLSGNRVLDYTRVSENWCHHFTLILFSLTLI
jgi:hypothetical protein